jgi:hypothetical protein
MANYLVWYSQTSRKFNSIGAYVQKERLGWETPIEPVSNTPFENPSDWKIIRNDWPYGTTPDITHLVVWFKSRLEVLPADGSPTAASQRLIEGFVNRIFEKDAGEDGKESVMWFKQKSLFQSVRAVEHIHVLVRDVDEDTIEKWTGQKAGDIHSRQWRLAKNGSGS